MDIDAFLMIDSGLVGNVLDQNIVDEVIPGGYSF